MKKIILCSLLLCGTLSFAQTTTPTKPTTTVPTAVVPTTTTQPQTTVAPKTVVAPKIDPALESIAKNVDRRLMFFNKYKQSADMESISQLVSEKNKDFYTNFIKYIKTAPLFTLKRDLAGKIIKAPNNEYIFPIVMTLDGKDKKVSMTFIEEKTEQGSKWLIANSNLHIQGVVPNTNLGSSAVNGTKPATTPKTTTTLPVVKNPAPALPAAPPASTGLDIMTIIFIALASVVILGGIVGYYVFAKHRKAKIIAASLAAAAASTVSASAPVLPEVPVSPETPVSPPPIAPITPVVPVSNVTVSSVEEIHNAPPSTPVPMKEPSQEENISKPVSLEENVAEVVPSETVITAQENTVSPIFPKENEDIQISPEQSTPSVPTLSLETISATKESYDDEQEKILEIASQPEPSPAPVVDSIILPVPTVEMPISDIFTAAPAPDNTPTQNTETDAAKTPHPLFG